MKKKDICKVVIALCLALLLLACEINPGGGQNGNNGSPGGPDGSGGDKKEYPVTIKIVELGETFFTVEWNALPGENIYSLTYTVNTTDHTTKSGYWGKGTRCTVENLIPGVSYYLSLWKMEPDGKRAMSISEKFVVKTASPSLVTPEVTVRATAYSIELSWPAIEGAARYHIYDEEYDTWVSYRVSTYRNFFNHNLDDRKGGEQFRYRVIALSADGKKASSFSNLVTAALKESTLENWPVTQALTSYETTFNWDALPAGYLLELTELVSPVSLTGTTDKKQAGSTGHSTKNVESGKNYYYRFRLKHPENGDASLHSELYTITVPEPELATAPANVNLVSIKESSYVAGYYNAEISWDAVPGAEEYYIYSDAYSSGNFLYKAKSTSLSYKYFFNSAYNPSVKVKVKAIKHSTKEGSDYSAPLTLTPIK